MFRSIRHSRVAALILAIATAGGVVCLAAGPGAATTAAHLQLTSSVQAAQGRQAEREHAACQAPAKGHFRCLALWRSMQPNGTAFAATSSGPKAAVKPPKHGTRPADIKAAYKLPAKGGKGQTIAVVDAFDNPKVEANLKVYRATWKLPACSTANKCFKKVDQRGGKAYPEGDSDWGVETSLDVQAVSATCPSCKILLVEADDNSVESLGDAVNTAVRLGATVVSNSYGLDEYNGAVADGAKYYTHPGVPIVVASGDSGFGAASFPAVMPNVWAAGGTYLTHTKKAGWKEQAWDSAGSGCSAWFAKPAAQGDTHCSMRTVADVSAMAYSDYGYAVYDTYGLGSDNGWIGVFGTSVSAPLLSGMIGLAGNAKKVAKPSYAYAHRTGLKDVVGGSNGYCGGDYLCTGLKGYDGPTGLGSPRGLKSL